MRNVAPYLKLVWNSPPDKDSRRVSHSAYDAVYAALEILRKRSPREARRMMRQILRDHAQVLDGGTPRRRPRRSRQLELFGEPSDGILVIEAIDTGKIIPWRSPVLLERDPGSCPRCGGRLVERSRVGSCRYYSCAAQGCPNTQAVFLLMLGTGDE